MTVQQTLHANLPDLTERQTRLAAALLADYPFAGLQPIQQLAESTGVSPPSISRFVQRLGFSGYGEFQHVLIAELREGSRSPRDLRSDAGDLADGCFLAAYSARSADLVRKLPGTVTQPQVDSVAALLADPSRNVYLRGGRISDALARFLTVHLHQIRPGIRHLADDPELWPEDVLRMRQKDVVVLFDFRRYQPSLERLAAAIRQDRRAQIVLVTDTWRSPVARHSNHVIALPIEIGTAWDSAACALALIETLIVTVSESDWKRTAKRIETWDALRVSLQNNDMTEPGMT